MAFQDILNSIQEQTDRDQLNALATKYASLREYAELGEQVAPLRERVKGYKDGFNGVVDTVERWNTWRTNNWDGEANMTHEERRAKALIAERDQRIADLEARQEAEMTGEELDARIAQRIKEAQLATQADLEARFVKAVARDKGDGKPGEIYDLVDQTQRGMGARFQEVFEKMTPKMHQHARDFDGEILNPKEVFDHMVKTGQTDPDKAYQEMVAPRLAEKKEAAHKKEVEDAKKSGVEEGRRQAMQSSAGRGIPVDGSGGRKMGPMEKRKMERFAAKADGDKSGAVPPLGKGVIARQATDQLLQKQTASSAE